jgi:hypothetical protein
MLPFLSEESEKMRGFLTLNFMKTSRRPATLPYLPSAPTHRVFMWSPCSFNCPINCIVMCMSVTIDWVIGFIEPLQLITISKDHALTALHTSQITTGHTRSSQSVTVFTSRCLVAVSNSGRSPSSRFPNCPWSQVPASQSNSSQLNPSGCLT